MTVFFLQRVYLLKDTTEPDKALYILMNKKCVFSGLLETNKQQTKS